MARKCPRVGDVVKVPVEMNSVCLVKSTEGIHLWVQSLRQPPVEIYVRRDSVEVLSYAN